MGQGAGEEWNEKHADTIQSQPQKEHKDTAARSGADSSSSSSSSGEGGCMKCCMRTKNCLMSAECGRCLQISSVVSFCGMCIRMWV